MTRLLLVSVTFLLIGLAPLTFIGGKEVAKINGWMDREAIEYNHPNFILLKPGWEQEMKELGMLYTNQWVFGVHIPIYDNNYFIGRKFNESGEIIGSSSGVTDIEADTICK